MEYRIEHDSLGEVPVPADKLWGAQTQRSLLNFPIGSEKIPQQIILALAEVKRAAAVSNRELGLLDAQRAELIVRVCDEILSGEHADQFPLAVWQTGSGTHTNMNVNEVVANRCAQLDPTAKVHPNDHVNRCQSSNDTFPTALRIAAVLELDRQLLPAVKKLEDTLAGLSEQYRDIVKIGRTHLQDATPLTLGQEISGWQDMLACDREQISAALLPLRRLAIGGTAVGTGLNADPKFGAMCASELARRTGEAFVSAPNKFRALTSMDDVVFAHGALKALAADMMKIANDVRWLSCGPRCGIHELRIPENEPGSSIMPGKVNPSQCESVTMVAVRVMGNDTSIGVAASQGNFQLNVFQPVTAYCFLQSAGLLADSALSFEARCARGIQPVPEVISRNLERSLMLVTALSPHIGYEKSAKIALTAYHNGTTLKEEAVNLGFLTPDQFDAWVVPSSMVL